MRVFSEGFEEYYDRIVRYTYVRIGDQNEAEHPGTDVFLRVHRSMGSSRGDPQQMAVALQDRAQPCR